MKRMLSLSGAVITMLGALALETILAKRSNKEIVGITPNEVRWFTPPYYTDGRQRAQLVGDSGKDGTWIDRVKVGSRGYFSR